MDILMLKETAAPEKQSTNNKKHILVWNAAVHYSGLSFYSVQTKLVSLTCYHLPSWLDTHQFEAIPTKSNLNRMHRFKV